MILKRFRLVGSYYNGLLIKNPKSQYVKLEVSEKKLICEKISGNEWFFCLQIVLEMYIIFLEPYFYAKNSKK